MILLSIKYGVACNPAFTLAHTVLVPVLGVNTKIFGFYALGAHYSSWGYPNFVELPKTCYLDVVIRFFPESLSFTSVPSLHDYL